MTRLYPAGSRERVLPLIVMAEAPGWRVCVPMRYAEGVGEGCGENLGEDCRWVGNDEGPAIGNEGENCVARSCEDTAGSESLGADDMCR